MPSITSKKILLALLAGMVLLTGTVNAEARSRTYQQIKDVSVKENGSVAQSSDKANLFEYTYIVDRNAKTITRTKVRRLDQPAAKDDATVYNIVSRQALWGSEAGNGGKVLVAVRKDGNEILELGHRFAFTMRTSPFSFVISGVYKRIYTGEHKGDHKHRDKS